MSSWSIRRINSVLRLTGGSRYLEIGVEHGTTLFGIESSYKVGVDPHFRFDADSVSQVDLKLLPINSDLAFHYLIEQGEIFDFIFLDGLHLYEQTYRDLLNSLELLDPERGFILIDDVFPIDEFSFLRNQEDCYSKRAAQGSSSRAWHGDVFKVIALLHDYHYNLNWATFVDNGNPQTLLWVDSPVHRVPRFQSIGMIDSLVYEQVVETQDILNWMPETQILSIIEKQLL